jgi:hypothetical protein
LANWSASARVMTPSGSADAPKTRTFGVPRRSPLRRIRTPPRLARTQWRNALEKGSPRRRSGRARECTGHLPARGTAGPVGARAAAARTADAFGYRVVLRWHGGIVRGDCGLQT